MRVLFLTCHLPYPPVSGGRLREHELLRRLGRGDELHVCAVSKTYDEDLAAAGRLDGTCASVAVSEAGPGHGDLPAQLRRHGSPAAGRYGGIKVKVLEALCRGKAIASTSIGAQGLGDGALIVADEGPGFARATAELLLDAKARRGLERRALARTTALGETEAARLR
jgi:hypothetical protein